MKTSKRNLFLGLLFFAGCLSFSGVNAQFMGVKGNGNVVQQERQVGDFTGIQILGSTDVIIRQGDRSILVVHADENLLENIITKVKNGVLIVDTEGSIRNYSRMEVFVTMSRLDEISIQGSGDVETDGVISGTDLSIIVNGSGDVDLNLDYKNLETEINGSGDVEVAGIQGDLTMQIRGSGDFKAKELRLNKCRLSIFGSGDVSLSGTAGTVFIEQAASGDINLHNLKTQDAEIDSSGSGDIIITVTGNLKAGLKGSGDLTYSGNPISMDVSSLGSGSVYKRNFGHNEN